MSLVKWMNGWVGRALRIVAGLDRCRGQATSG